MKGCFHSNGLHGPDPSCPFEQALRAMRSISEHLQTAQKERRVILYGIHYNCCVAEDLKTFGGYKEVRHENVLR